MQGQQDATGSELHAQDAADLARGARLNLFGMIARAGFPALLLVATNLYGAKSWGTFAMGQMLIYIIARFAMGGLDSALLYMVPRHEGSGTIPGLRASLVHVVVWSCVAMSVWLGLVGMAISFDASHAWLQELVLQVRSQPWAFATMGLTIIPIALSDLLNSALIARKDLRPQIIVREIVVPMFHAGASVLLFFTGAGVLALACAFLCAQATGASLLYRAFRRSYANLRGVPHEVFRLPIEVSRYARPLWVADMANSCLHRLDTVVLGMVAGPAYAGAYDVVSQFSNTIRGLRGNYEGFVTTIVAGISIDRDPRRLSEGFSRASATVMTLQLPALFVFFAFGDVLLSLWGDGFGVGSEALWIRSAGHLLVGMLGLSGQVVSGYGRARQTRFAHIAAFVVLVCALYSWVPRWNIEGAAYAISLALVVQSSIQLIQMRLLTHAWNYRVSFVRTIAASVLGLAMASAFAWTASLNNVSHVWVRVAATVGFLCVYAPNMWRTVLAPSPVNQTAERTSTTTASLD